MTHGVITCSAMSAPVPTFSTYMSSYAVASGTEVDMDRRSGAVTIRQPGGALTLSRQDATTLHLLLAQLVALALIS